jgi:hypothetical protein
MAEMAENIKLTNHLRNFKKLKTKILEKLLISSIQKHLRAIFVNGGFWKDKIVEIRCSYGLLIFLGILSISFTIN